MGIRATIILDTGGFLTKEKPRRSYHDVGYFQTSFKTDIQIWVDGKKVVPAPEIKLGTGNRHIDVEHLDNQKKRIEGVDESPFFRKDILVKRDLYEDKEIPDFDDSAYDCILRFHSGTFESSDVKARTFYECNLVDGARAVGKDKEKKLRAIANDVAVQYLIGDGEELRLRGEDGKDLWTTKSLPKGTARVEVKLRADKKKADAYFRKGFKHKCSHFYMPNPDPPPTNGPGGAGG